MASRPPTPWALVVIYGLLDQKEMSNDFWFKPSAEPDLSNWDGVGWSNYMYTTLSGVLAPCLSTSVKLKGAASYFGGAGGTLGFEYYHDVPGTISSAALPEDVSVVVAKYSNSFLPSARGRWFFSGTPQTFSTNSYLNGSGNAAWTTFAGAMGTTLVDQTVSYEPHIWGPTGNLFTKLIEASPVAQLATRRRRRFRF